MQAVIADGTQIITNPAVMGKFSEDLKGRASEVANSGIAEFAEMNIEAIPAYTISEDRLSFHRQGRDDGYVLNSDGFRIYISGDTEDTPEMRA